MNGDRLPAGERTERGGLPGRRNRRQKSAAHDLPALLRQRGSEDENLRGGHRFAQSPRFTHVGHAEHLHQSRNCPRHLRRAVAVCLGFHNRHDPRMRTDIFAHDTDIVPQRAGIDLGPAARIVRHGTHGQRPPSISDFKFASPAAKSRPMQPLKNIPG